MPNQRSTNKIRVTVPMEKWLEKEISEECKRTGMDRVALIKAACASYLENHIRPHTHASKPTQPAKKPIRN
jgi:hypothetical protein